MDNATFWTLVVTLVVVMFVFRLAYVLGRHDGEKRKTSKKQGSK
jgi:hypothetical protein